jgi:hypothetical protein
MAYAPPRYQEIMDEVVDKSQTFYYYNSIVKICAPIYIGTEVFQKHSINKYKAVWNKVSRIIERR